MNLYFFNTLYLWALPLALTPVIIHLMFRRKPAAVPFSDLRFVRLALEKIRAGSRLRKYLLLAVRMLIIALIILFFARPLWHKGGVSSFNGRDSQSIVLFLFDVSYSMGYRNGAENRLDEFKRTARKLLAVIPASTRVGVIGYSNRVEAASAYAGNDHSQVLRAIDELKLTARPTDVSVCFPKAAGLAADFTGSSVTMVLFSDLAEHGFTNTPRGLDNPYRIITFPPQYKKNSNGYVQSVKASFEETAAQWEIDCAAVAGDNATTPTVSCYIGGRRTGDDFLKIDGDRRGRHRFYYPRDTASISGKIETGPDPLLIDNVFYFSGRRQPRYGLWIIDGDPQSGGITSESFYLRTAFPDAEVYAESEVERIRFSLPGTVILANLRNNHPQIESFASSGGGVLVFPGSHSSDTFEPPYLPATIGSEFDGESAISWTDAGHPVATAAALAEFEWKNIAATRGFILQPAAGSRTLAAMSSGWPFLVEGAFGRGRVIMCASTADREGNTLVARPLYVPLVHALARYLSKSDTTGEGAAYVVGDTFHYSNTAGAGIITPSGTAVQPRASASGMELPDLAEPGIYRIVSDGKEISSFAVNLDMAHDESALMPAGTGRLKEYFKNGKVIALKKQDDEKEFLAVISGVDITRALMAAALMLMLAEILLSYKGKSL